jgi:hypothetical protein
LVATEGRGLLRGDGFYATLCLVVVVETRLPQVRTD